MDTIGPTARRPALLCLTLLFLIAPTKVSFAAGWTDIRAAGPFICHADFPLTGMEGIFADLTELQNDLVRCLAIPSTQERIEIYLFQNQSTYRDYLSQHLPDVPYRRALYIKLRGPGMVFAYRSRELDVDLRHECTHALLHAALPMVPLWLDEGLAEYFEVAPPQRASGNPHFSSVRWAVRFGLPPKLESLEKRSDLSEMGKPEYRGAWAWTHFMLHGPPEAHDELIRFLRDIQAGAPPGQLSHRLSHRLPNLSRQFSEHFRNWNR